VSCISNSYVDRKTLITNGDAVFLIEVTPRLVQGMLDQGLARTIEHERRDHYRFSLKQPI
jgi:hypothetical protein